VKALEVEAYLQSLNGGWVDYSQSVDTWKAGDPEAEVKGIAVAWMSYRWALEKAAEMGCNLLDPLERRIPGPRPTDREMRARPGQADLVYSLQAGLYGRLDALHRGEFADRSAQRPLGARSVVSKNVDKDRVP